MTQTLSSTKQENIACPSCKKKGTWTQDNASRPFCSPRCKLIDLGAWATEQHRIPGEKANDAESSSEQ